MEPEQRIYQDGGKWYWEGLGEVEGKNLGLQSCEWTWHGSDREAWMTYYQGRAELAAQILGIEVGVV